MATIETFYMRTILTSDALTNQAALHTAIGASVAKSANTLVKSDADGFISPDVIASGTRSPGHVATVQSDGSLAWAAQTGGGGGGAAGFYSSGPNTLAQNDSLDLAIGATSAPIVNAWVMEQQTAVDDATETFTYSSTYASEFTELSEADTEFTNNHLQLTKTTTSSPIILLHFNDESGSTSFADACGRTVTRNGSPTIGTSPAGYYGNGCGSFSSNDYLSIASHADFAYASSDLTIQFRIYMSSSQSTRVLLFRQGYELIVSVGHATATDWTSGGTTIGLHVYYDNVSWGLQLAGSSGLSTGAWHHVAVTRAGSTWKIYVDGTLQSTATYSRSVAAATINIGGQSEGGRTLSGYLDQLAVNTNLIYNGNFTPPADQLDYISYVHGAYKAVKNADGYYLSQALVSSIVSLAITQSELTLATVRWLYTTDGGTTWKNHSGSTVDPADIGSSGSTKAQMESLWTNWTPPEGGTEIGLMCGLYAQNFTLTPNVTRAIITYDGPVSWVRRDHGDSYTISIFTGASGVAKFTRTGTGSKTVYLVAQNGN